MRLLPWKRAASESAAETPSFEDLALPLLPSLYNVASWLCRNPVEAEDLVQETFLKGLGGFAGFEAGTNFRAWIFRILRNTFLTSRTGLAARRTVALEDEIAEPGERENAAPAYPEAAIDRQSPEVNLMRMSDRAAVEAAMQELPPHLLEVVLLCDVEEMKYREIASVLDVPIGTVMSRVSRARRVLRAALATYRPARGSGA